MTTLAGLIAQYRHQSGDKEVPYLVSAQQLSGFATEAQNEACRRMDLIREVDDAGMCEVAVSAGDTSFDFDARWTRITGAWWQPAGTEDATDPERWPLEIVVDRRRLDRVSSSWRTRSGEPNFLLIENRRGRFDCIPSADGTLILEGFRLPKALKLTTDAPEINEVHHDFLVHWMLKLVFEGADNELRDVGRAQREEQDFERHFGPRRDGDLYQAAEDCPATNVSHF